GLAALREISRRTGDDERQFVGDAHRNHVAFNPLAEANAGIEALGHDVGQNIANGHRGKSRDIAPESAEWPRNERVIAFYTPDSCHCGLRVVVWNPADVDATSTIGLRMSLIPQQVMYIATPENGSLGLQCTDGAETLAVVQSDGVGLMHRSEEH